MKQPTQLTDRVYHGWLDDRIVSVDRVLVRDGVAEITDRLPWAPPRVGESFLGFEWGPNVEPASGTASSRTFKRSVLSYALLLDCYGVRELALRYLNYFDAQILQSIAGDVPFQILGGQVRTWITNQIRADNSLGYSESGATRAPAMYVCPVCGSLEFETAKRRAGLWCHFYPLANMIQVDPLALAGDVHHLPPEMKVPATAADGFGWSDAAHAAAGVKPADTFAPRQIGGVPGG